MSSDHPDHGRLFVRFHIDDSFELKVLRDKDDLRIRRGASTQEIIDNITEKMHDMNSEYWTDYSSTSIIFEDFRRIVNEHIDNNYLELIKTKKEVIEWE